MNNQRKKEWVFFEYSDRETRRDSSSNKHFKGQTINASLVRELIQNSLDAVSDDKQPVSINIRFKEIEIDKCCEYIEGLKDHYEVSFDKKFLESRPKLVKFLIIEDFNTTGLKGDKAENFFRKDNIRTSTDNSSGGSHGIGKIVFYVASKINTFFAYSVFKETEENYSDIFEGACDFKTHILNGKEYKEDGALVLSSEKDKVFIQEFSNRSKEQTGLSIAIPLPEEELKLEELKKEILEEYYYPLINDKLIINIEGTIVNADYILEQSGEKYELISHYVTADSDMVIDLGVIKRTNIDVLNEKQIEQVISTLNENQSIFIQFNVSIECKYKQIKNGYFDFIICNKAGDNYQKYDFWRENLLIREASRRKNESKQYAAIILINGRENELSTLLRKLENPSHTRWDYQDLSSEIKDSYQYIPQLITFITQLPNKVISQLKNLDIELDSNFFSDIFPEDSAVGKKIRQEGNPQTGKPDIPDDNSNFKFYFRQINSGFILTLKKSDQFVEFNISIELAYGTNKGNPFKNYDRRDFDLAKDMDINVQDGELTKIDANKLTCSINNSDFKLSLSGFDPDREMKINIQEV